ncbi:DNA polymerase alpha/epsilon subunit B-domain-containing protein [Boletus edulis BED1]|uniref:DNA-directed DNA polymerase n=1 Tax=Boletus edulis BED1 TaxID=1328754 RepID=A0AAD4C3U4_BOLED|nr:DNA polymerase alpha/epsilon subunit B-domain-containing protein [Boletus edulis BED1]
MRCSSVLLPPTGNSSCFVINSKNRSYKHQYSNIYFTRLAMLKKPVLERAKARWEDLDGSPVYVPRVLDVIKSQLCWVLGTVYMDMPLKPNVLEDLGRDHSLPPPQFKEKIYSDQDSITLEDESGRIKLVGQKLLSTHLVTGVIVAALGMETPGGEFEVIDMCFADLAPFAEQYATGNNGMDVDSGTTQPDEYLAVVSGLSIGTESKADAQIQILVEYLSGEVGGLDDQTVASQITRLIIAGNSLSSVAETENGAEEDDKKPKKLSTVTPSDISPHPNSILSAHLHDLASALPVHILPGPDDPSGAILPQQPFPRAMFSGATNFETFHRETNPVWLRLRCGTDEQSSSKGSSSPRPPVTRSVLVTSGQPVLDMFKYLPTPPFTLVSIAELTLKWRHIAPTAPDTLWCHPYYERDPFVLRETPDVYIIGGMSTFATTLVGAEQDGKRKRSRQCRLVLLPSFTETGTLVLINMRTLDVHCVKFGVKGLSAGGGQAEIPEEDAMQEG